MGKIGLLERFNSVKEDKSKNIFEEFNTDVLIKVPKDLFTRGNMVLKPVDKLVYMLIEVLSYRKGYCWATTETIQKSLGIGSNATVISSIKKLERLNFVRIEKRVSRGVPRRVIWPMTNIVAKKTSDKRDDLPLEVLEYKWYEEDDGERE